MSSMPECIKCGNYIHSGYVVCDKCNDELPTIRAELKTLRALAASRAGDMATLLAENARLTAEVEAAADFIDYLQEFLAFDAAWADSDGHHWTKYKQARASRVGLETSSMEVHHAE